MNKIVLIVSLLLLSTLIGCQPAAEKTEKQAKTAATPKAQTDSDGIPVAEKGITVVRKDGWTTDEMDFQIGYCVSTVSNLSNLNGVQFCECFLGKIQYYYEPRFSKEAYEDQAKWNQECFEAATIE